jgi:hypothetical protein
MSSAPDRVGRIGRIGRIGPLVVALALAACTGGNSAPRSDEVAGSARGPSAPTAPTAPTAPEPAAPPTMRAPVTVQTGSNVVNFEEPKIDLPKQESFKLLDAGKGARAPLRYALAAGTTRFFTQATISSRHLEHGAFTSPLTVPPVRDGFAITVGDGGRSLALLPLPGEAPSTSREAEAYLVPWRTLLQNRRITVAFDDRGAFSAIRFNDDPASTRSARAKDELVQRLLSLIVPVPVEPVGAGASWRVVTILRQGPAYAKQTATYTLTSRTANAWKVHAQLQRVGEEQRISDPSLPPGTTADLLAMFRNVEGDVEIDPAQPLVTGGSLAVESRLHVKLQAPGQTAAQAIEQIFEDTGAVAFSRER